MATRAYVLIKVKAGRSKQVLNTLRAMKGVQQVHFCFGQPDIFSFVSASDGRGLAEMVLTKIHAIEGVEETGTHIVADADS